MVRKTNPKSGRSACAEFPLGRRGRRNPKAIRRRDRIYSDTNIAIYCLGASMAQARDPDDDLKLKIKQFRG
jgi:hypothetical protein